jgi:hypothetical protein
MFICHDYNMPGYYGARKKQIPALKINPIPIQGFYLLA